MENDFLLNLQKILSHAQAGLTYCENKYDLERYQGIKSIVISMISEYTSSTVPEVKNFYPDSDGYLTPKVDVRAVVVRDNKILLIRENSDGFWALPGGWADVGLTPSQVVAKEVKEEAGFEVSVKKLLAVHDKAKHSSHISYMYIYKLFFLCEIIGGKAEIGIETSGVDFFGLDELPQLSEGRSTKEQIELMVKLAKQPSANPDFD